MANINLVIDNTTRAVSKTRAFAGVCLENLQDVFVVGFSGDFIDGDAQMEYEVNGMAYYTPMTKDTETNTYTLDITQMLISKEGTYPFQVRIDVGDAIFKSQVFYLKVYPSINAVDGMPSYYGWQQWVIDYVDEHGGNIDTIKENGVALEIVDKSVNVVVPTKTSDLQNNSGFITSASLPTKTSQLQNDSGFITSAYHDNTKQDTLVSGTNIKTINGNSVIGSGNVQIKTYQSFNSSWVVNSTTDVFCANVDADANAVEGMAYMGDVYFTDLPSEFPSSANADAVVEIITGTGTSGKVIHIILTSGNINPYHWEYTYWNNGSSTSGWIGYQQKLVSGTNIKTINNTSLLGSGNIEINTGSGLYRHTITMEARDGNTNIEVVMVMTNASSTEINTEVLFRNAFVYNELKLDICFFTNEDCIAIIGMDYNSDGSANAFVSLNSALPINDLISMVISYSDSVEQL